MPIYLMDSKGDDHHLDWMTRQRMKESNDEIIYIAILFAVVTFVLGMIVGSSLHDGFFHLTEMK